jgi:DNA-binding response OmpR family regulator
LVVEDDATVRTVITGRLRAVGHEVQIAADGRKGLEAAKQLGPDIVLTDWMMPEMSGMDLIRALRADAKLRSVYVVLLTSRDGIHDRVAGLEQGADEYLIKPWSDEELLARIQAGLRIQRLQRELASAEHKAVLLTLAATLGHEINNPLTSLSAILQIARLRPESDPGLLDLLDRCEAQVERIVEVVTALRHLNDPRVTSYLGSTPMLNLHQSGIEG